MVTNLSINKISHLTYSWKLKASFNAHLNNQIFRFGCSAGWRFRFIKQKSRNVNAISKASMRQLASGLLDNGDETEEDGKAMIKNFLFFL